MQTVNVNLDSNSYEIRIGRGLLPQIGGALKKLGFSSSAIIIADSNVKPLYADIVQKSLAEAGFNVTVLEIPAGEQFKTLQSAGKLYRALNEINAERSTLIIALGGGITGDIAGFVAATYRRGVPYVQIPTTLLAMTDSAIGGKTAVDHARVKNLVGAFYQPRLVIADIDTLKTLPKVELANGMAEVIKIFAIYSESMFSYVEKNIKKTFSVDTVVLERIIVENARLKASVVERDEKETGAERLILNYGHTIGHAVESVSGYALKHGQAVAIGMVAENEIARRMGYLNASAAQRIEKLIKAAGLPVHSPSLSVKKIMAAMRQDKKVLRGRV
ncbi:MAG TPA: 3-dehydroquinate synthase, partial [Dehalococcoidales bacterium]|nr:3-dehydroquinate synthase [Dehalococcoidales bacterium]